MLTVGAAGAAMNVAVTAVGELMVTAQATVPPHAPLHPANVDPAAAEAVSVTGVPLA
jgi:hypothetical protein